MSVPFDTSEEDSSPPHSHHQLPRLHRMGLLALRRVWLQLARENHRNLKLVMRVESSWTVVTVAAALWEHHNWWPRELRSCSDVWRWV